MKKICFCLLMLSFAIGHAQTADDVAKANKAAGYPVLSLPGAVNTAAVPAPRTDKGPEAAKVWLQRFQGKITHSEAFNAEKPIQVIFEGDSITDYFQTYGKDTWKVIQDNYRAWDFGGSGETTQNVLYRLENGQAKGLHPKLIFLMIGHNNVMNNTAEQIYEGVDAIIKKYQEICPDAVIILQATFPSKGVNSPYRRSIADLDKLLPKLAQDGKVVYLDLSDKFVNPDGSLVDGVFRDGTHPTAKGYEVWFAAIKPILDQYVPPASGSPSDAPAATPSTPAASAEPTTPATPTPTPPPASSAPAAPAN